MQKRNFGIIAGILAVTGASFSVQAASKLDEWKMYRPLIEKAVACEKGYIDSYLNYLDEKSTSYIDPDKDAIYTDADGNIANKKYIRKLILENLTELDRVQRNLKTRQDQLAAAKNLVPITDDQKCSNDLFQALQTYFNSRPHGSLEDVNKSLNSSIGNYLIGRWAMYQARLGHGDRVKTATAWGLADLLNTLKTTDLKRPGDEFGDDPAVQQAAAGDTGDKLLALWISWKSDGGEGMDQVGNSITDINENIRVNGIFSYNKTTFEKVQERIGNPLDKAIVGKVVPSIVKGEPVIQKEAGKGKLIVDPKTYSVVFFKPISFTTTECASYVSAKTWFFSNNTLSLNQVCDDYVKRNASMTPYPVAVDPEFAKTLKADTSNLNCLLNSSPRIDINAKENAVLASYPQMMKVWVENTKKWVPISKTQTVYATGVHQSEKKTLTYAWTNAPSQYDQSAQDSLDVCAPKTVYNGSGSNKKLVNFFGIPIK